MTMVIYWAGFTAACVAVFCGPWLCARFEERSERLDREVWARMPGAIR